jgi:hypothetical protein
VVDLVAGMLNAMRKKFDDVPRVIRINLFDMIYPRLGGCGVTA